MSIRVRRGTRAAINAARQAGQLLFGEMFIGTDDNKPGVAIASNAYREIPLLGADGKLPAVDGSQLTNLPGDGIGYGQTWQDVAASRSEGTAYQNITGKPIQVNISVTGTSVGVNCYFEVSINNTDWTRVGYFQLSTQTGAKFFDAVVPDGVYYRLDVNSSNFTIAYWSELR